MQGAQCQILGLFSGLFRQYDRRFEAVFEREDRFSEFSVHSKVFMAHVFEKNWVRQPARVHRKMIEMVKVFKTYGFLEYLSSGNFKSRRL